MNVRRITGNKNVPNQLVQLANQGSGAQVVKGYSEGGRHPPNQVHRPQG